MKPINVFIFMLVLFANQWIGAQESKIVGTWWNEEKTSQIRVFKATNGLYYGKVEYLKDDPNQKDVNNPDPEKQQEPVLGLIILKSFKYDKAKMQWNSGTVYDPENGKTYDCYLWMDEDPKLMHLKGYVMGMKFVGRETLWERVN